MATKGGRMARILPGRETCFRTKPVTELSSNGARFVGHLQASCRSGWLVKVVLDGDFQEQHMASSATVQQAVRHTPSRAQAACMYVCMYVHALANPDMQKRAPLWPEGCTESAAGLVGFRCEVRLPVS